MKFGEKLSALVAKSGKSRAEIARLADVLPATLHNYIARNVEPLSSSALRIAKALRVPLEWMLDESQGLPAPDLSTLSSMPTVELQHELGARMIRSLGENWLPKLERAEALDWSAIGRDLCDADPAKALPATFAEALLPFHLNGLVDDLRAFDPRSPNAGDRQSLLELNDRFHLMRDGWAVQRVVMLLMAVWPQAVTRGQHRQHRSMPNAAESIARAREEFAGMIADREAMELHMESTWKNLPESERRAVRRAIKREEAWGERNAKVKKKAAKKRG